MGMGSTSNRGGAGATPPNRLINLLIAATLVAFAGAVGTLLAVVTMAMFGLAP